MGCGSAAAKEPAKQAPAAPAGQPPNRGAPPAATATAEHQEEGDGKKMVYNKETGHFEEAKDNLEKKDRPDVYKAL
jgi:hypothetical protein